MVNRFSALILGLCMTGAAGGVQAEGGRLLTAAEMDAVTAAGNATFSFGALATAGTAATTTADGVAQTWQANLIGQSHQQAEVSVSMGHANAVALGEDSEVSSSVNPVTGVTAGPAVYNSTFGLTIRAANGVMSIGWSYSSTTTANPWALTGM